MKRVAIIGAAGYVGMELARQLRGAELAVLAVTRENGRFLLRDFGFNLVAPDGLTSLKPVDVVVNLAYPTSGPVQHYPIRNRELLGQIASLMGPSSRLIHVSTQAVFGLALDRLVTTGPVELVRDYPYVEAKIELENLILERFPENSVQIVRFGNIWGPGSGAWTVPLVNKVLFGEPVGVDGLDGFCNVTDVANAASYLVHLIGRDDLKGTDFYHLAEMSGYRWSDWIQRIEIALGQEAVREQYLPNCPSSFTQEVRQALAPVMPGPLYQNLVWGRVSGSLMRSMKRTIGDQRFNRIKKRSPKVLPRGYSIGTADQLFLKIISSATQFNTHVLDGWHPPVDFEQSWSNVENWMDCAGYLVHKDRAC